MTAGYWESTLPGHGRRSPRADAVTDARVQNLNGAWRFRLSPTAAGTGDGFIADDFDDADWDVIRVPAHWVLEPITPLAGGPARSSQRFVRSRAPLSTSIEGLEKLREASGHSRPRQQVCGTFDFTRRATSKTTNVASI